MLNAKSNHERKISVIGEKKTASRNLMVIILAALAIIALIGLATSLIIDSKQNSTLQDKDKQITNLQSQLSEPKLVSIGLQYADNRSDPNAPFLQITGYVVNVGSVTANNCTIHVNASQSGNVTAINTTATITPSLRPGAYQAIDMQFPYTGQALMTYTSYISWTS